MPTSNGQTTEYTVVTTANDDTSMNAAIAAQDADEWSVVSLTPNGSDITILFSRTTAAV